MTDHWKRIKERMQEDPAYEAEYKAWRKQKQQESRARKKQDPEWVKRQRALQAARKHRTPTVTQIVAKEVRVHIEIEVDMQPTVVKQVQPTPQVPTLVKAPVKWNASMPLVMVPPEPKARKVKEKPFIKGVQL